MNTAYQSTSSPRIRSRSRGEQALLGVVEIGADRVLVMVAERMGEHMQILGVGEVRTGTDFGMMEGALTEAFNLAECKAAKRVKKVILCVGGKYVEAKALEVVVHASGLGGRCTKFDEKIGQILCFASYLAEDRCVLHYLPSLAELDGVVVSKRIAGRKGKILRMRGWRLHADKKWVSQFIDFIEGRGCVVRDVVFSGLAAAQAVTTDEERTAGVLILHQSAVGADYVLYRYGVVVNIGTVIGSGAGAARQIEARAMLNELRRRLGVDHIPEMSLAAGVVVTGEEAVLSCLAGVAAEVFAAPVRVGCPSADLGDLSGSPEYAAVLGAWKVGR